MSKIDELLKQNHNSQRKHLKKLAKTYMQIQKIAFDLKAIATLETEHLTDKLINRLQVFEDIILNMLLSHRGKK